jgi:hypothetical protein
LAPAHCGERGSLFLRSKLKLSVDLRITLGTPMRANSALEQNMPTRKAKRGVKKSARMKRGKKLQPVKPLDSPKEAVTFTYGATEIKYTPQN